MKLKKQREIVVVIKDEEKVKLIGKPKKLLLQEVTRKTQITCLCLTSIETKESYKLYPKVGENPMIKEPMVVETAVTTMRSWCDDEVAVDAR